VGSKDPVAEERKERRVFLRLDEQNWRIAERQVSLITVVKNEETTHRMTSTPPNFLEKRHLKRGE